MSSGEGRFCLPWVSMECEFQDSYGFLENEVTLVMSRDELHQLRVAISLAQIHLPDQNIFRDFLGATD